MSFWQNLFKNRESLVIDKVVAFFYPSNTPFPINKAHGNNLSPLTALTYPTAVNELDRTTDILCRIREKPCYQLCNLRGLSLALNSERRGDIGSQHLDRLELQRCLNSATGHVGVCKLLVSASV